MQIEVIGGGPSGLFAASLLKKSMPGWTVRLHERNRPEETFGFGVVFSERTLKTMRALDPDLVGRMERQLTPWDSIDTFAKGQYIRAEGHRFSGCSRSHLLELLLHECKHAGVDLRLGHSVADAHGLAGADLVVAADGIGSRTRERRPELFGARKRWGTSRFAWMATDLPLEAFTFFFRENEAGLWQVHAYPYQKGRCTFIVETDEATWRAAGMHNASEKESIDYLQGLFSRELQGHSLFGNESFWRRFPTVNCETWSSGNVVLLGDAAHSTHFSIGSGTRLAMQGAGALAEALVGCGAVEPALAQYEDIHRPEVERLQQAAELSRVWFETARFRYRRMTAAQLTSSMMGRTRPSRRRQEHSVHDHSGGFACAV